MNTIPTEEEFLKSKGLGGYQEFQGVLIEFATLHVNKALSEANKGVLHIMNTSCYAESQWFSKAKMIESSILDAYSLDNIK